VSNSPRPGCGSERDAIVWTTAIPTPPGAQSRRVLSVRS
jgi:hypothetical protein